MKNLFYVALLFVCTLLLTACGSDGGSDPDPSLELSVPSIELCTSSAGYRTVIVTSSHEWSGSTAAVAAWVTLEPSSGAKGSTEVTIKFEENQQPEERETDIVFTLADGLLSQTLHVAQAQKDIIDIGNDDTITIGSEGGDIEIEVGHNVDISVEVEYSEAGTEPWITEKPGTRALTTDRLVFSVSPNGEISPRSARINVLGKGGRVSAEVMVMQDAVEPVFTISQTRFEESGLGGTVSFTIDTNLDTYDYSVSFLSGGGWLTYISDEPDENGFDVWYFFLDRYYDAGSVRDAEITFTNSSFDISETVSVSQSGVEAPEDGSYYLLQQAGKGDGIDLVIMGDGYTQAEVENGVYAVHMKETMESFFSVYPYTRYREYFNVWMVVGISNDSGVTIGSNSKDTAFNARIAGDGTTGITCNYRKVGRYIALIPGMPESYEQMNEITSILVLNSTEYAGTCYIFSHGFSVGMCPRIYTGDTRPNYGRNAVVIHECGGHGFGRLADEYYYGDDQISQEYKDQLLEWQGHGAYPNVDLTSNHGDILWSDFFRYDKYTDSEKAVYQTVGAYEGGYYHAYGVWRPERNSCMIDNIDYYNAPSRWAIINRIMELSGTPYSFEQFVTEDNPPPPSYPSASKMNYVEETKPFASPILVK